MSNEVLLTISQVCRRLPGARGAEHVTPSTVTRWILHGCPARSGSRVKLAATRAGGRWLVQPADLDKFFAALADESNTSCRNSEVNPGHDTAGRRAGELLQKLGA